MSDESHGDASLKILALAQLMLPDKPREFHEKVGKIIGEVSFVAYRRGTEEGARNERLNEAARKMQGSV